MAKTRAAALASGIAGCTASQPAGPSDHREAGQARYCRRGIADLGSDRSRGHGRRTRNDYRWYLAGRSCISRSDPSGLAAGRRSKLASDRTVSGCAFVSAISGRESSLDAAGDTSVGNGPGKALVPRQGPRNHQLSKASEHGHGAAWSCAPYHRRPATTAGNAWNSSHAPTSYAHSQTQCIAASGRRSGHQYGAASGTSPARGHRYGVRAANAPCSNPARMKFGRIHRLSIHLVSSHNPSRGA